MAVYTKRGDKGETSLFDGAARQNIRVSKDSLRIRAIGAVDEANSSLGVVVSFSSDKNLNLQIIRIQTELFTIGSILAGAKLRFSKARTVFLERRIDKLEGSLPVLRNFILPGGSVVGSHVQVSRTLVRRAERQIVTLSKLEPVKPQILTYLNRLSDFLFMLSRKVNEDEGIKELVWVGRKK
jgi:cob(I)alamin adenosyltransferase